MDSITKTMASAAQGLRANAARIRIAAENIANAKTPGYQRKMPIFGQVTDKNSVATSVEVSRITTDRSQALRIYEPGHPLADENGFVTYSNVRLFVEMADAREAQRSYEANLQTFDQARRMYNRVLDILKR